MLGEQELQERYGLSNENLRWVKSAFMKVLRHFLNTGQIDLELKFDKPSFQTEIQAELERLWEEVCLELAAHPQEYCLMDTAPLDSSVRNFAWGLNAIIKARLEINFRLELQELQTEEPSPDCTKAELAMKQKQLDVIDEQRLNLGKWHFEAVNTAPAVAEWFDFVDRREEKLERLTPFSRIDSKTSFRWLKIPAAIIAAPLLSFALLFGMGRLHLKHRSIVRATCPSVTLEHQLCKGREQKLL